MRTKNIAAVLQSLEDSDGRIQASKVLKVAAAPKHPLHSCFDWDDSIAGHKWRLEQARELIRSVRVNITVDHISTPVICYVRDPQMDQSLVQGYRSVKKLARDSDDARDAVDAEFEQAAAHLRRARDIAVSLGFKTEIERRLYDVIDLQKTIKAGKKQTQVAHA